MKKNTVAKTSIFVTLILIGAVLLSNPGGRFGGTVQGSTPPSIAWSRHYGGYYTDEKAYSMVQTSDGGYALAGTIYSYPNPPVGYHALLIKTDSNGNQQWNRTYGGKGEDQVRAVVQTSDGGYALAGYTNSFSSGDFDFWLIKTNSNGNEQWNMTYGTAGAQDYAYSMLQTRDGGYALAGYGMPSGASDYKAMLVMTDSAGNLLWTQYYGAPGDRFYSITQMSNGNYALAGTWFWILGADGSQVLEGGNPDTQAIYAYSIVQTSDGGCAYAGDKNSLHVGNDIFLVKTGTGKPYGAAIWNSTYGGDNDDSCNSVVQTSGGGYALAGRTKSYGAGNWDFYLVKADSNGSLEWQQTYGGALDDGAYCVIETSDGGVALAGYSKSYTNGGYDMWLVKLSAFLPPPYPVTIWSWDSDRGWLAEPIQMDGVSTGLTTPRTFNGLFGTHNFTVPTNDTYSNPFGNWSTGEASTTLTVSSNGTYTARYYVQPTPVNQFQLRVSAIDAGVLNVTFQADYTSFGTAYVNTVHSTPWKVYADAGTTATIHNASTLISGPTGIRWRYLGPTLPHNVTMDFSRSVTLEYRRQVEITLSVSPAGSGNITYWNMHSNIEGTRWYDAYNQIYAIQANANPGYKFKEWTASNPNINIYSNSSAKTQFTAGGPSAGPGTITAVYESSVGNYSATIWSWDNVTGWLAQPITMNGVSTGFTTPHTFTDLVGSVTFTVPSADGYGSPFGNWTTGETSTTITVNSNGTYTAQYYKTNSITVWAWDSVYGWLSEPITMDGVSTGFSTPHTFTGLSGTHTFTVPSTDTYGDPLGNWTTGEASTTLTVNSSGTYTAQYYYGTIPEFDSATFLAVIFIVTSALTLVLRKQQKSAHGTPLARALSTTASY